MQSNQMSDEAAFAPDAEQNKQRLEYAEENPERVQQLLQTNGGLTEGQLMELLQNADQLSLDQQQQLQIILKDRWKKELKS